jgi:hypothetical protein
MKFWLCASAAGLLLALAPGQLAGTAGDGDDRKNETILAGLRPGRDKLSKAVKLLGKNYWQVVPESDDVVAWVDKAKRRMVRVELDKDEMIQSVTVSTIDPLIDRENDPKAEPETPLPAARLATGQGIRIAQSVCREVENTYGEANSSGPSTQHGKDLSLLYYAFDWAGPKVPQVMEVSCARSNGVVVQITLAYPSL